MEKYLAKLRTLGNLLAHEHVNYWKTLLDELSDEIHRSPSSTLVIKNVGRKWELVSAYQKTVRRGDVPLAIQLVSAMASLNGERQYMWRRICTVAAEDIGAGNSVLMIFVLAASSVFTPSTLPPTQTTALWAFLTRLMCLSAKSRLYCQLSLLHEAWGERGSENPTFRTSELGRQLGKIVSTDFRSTDLLPAARWLATANWRAEGMAVGPLWHEMLCTADQEAGRLTVRPWSPPQAVTLKGLPSYCYDKHTQTGKAALSRACALPAVRKVFNEYRCADKREALGWALFYEEGGRIENELRSTQIGDVEQRFVAHRFGLPGEGWLAVRGAVADFVGSGQLDEIRAYVLEKRGYCDNCIQLRNCTALPAVARICYSAQQTLIESGTHRG